MKSQIVIQDLDLILNRVGDNKYSLYIFDIHSNVKSTLRFKNRNELEDRLMELFSERQGVVSPKVSLLLHGDEGMIIPHINDRTLVRRVTPPYEQLIEDGTLYGARILYMILNHDDLNYNVK